MKEREKLMNSSICENIVKNLLEKIEKTQKLPWQNPVKRGYIQSGGVFPRNYISGREYSGLNTLTLLSKQHDTLDWLTYKQAIDLGGHVRKGEQGTMIFYWKFSKLDPLDTETGELTERQIPLLKTYYVFNLSQCDLPAETCAKLNEKREQKASVIVDVPKELTDIPSVLLSDHYPPVPPQILYDSTRPHYDVTNDTIHLPTPDAFIDIYHYLSTVFHETIHSTAHTSRLDRHIHNRFGDTAYSREELVAEIGAYFLSLRYQLDISSTYDNTIAYLQGWLSYLRSNPQEFVLAGGQAQRAVNYIFNIK